MSEQITLIVPIKAKAEMVDVVRDRLFEMAAIMQPHADTSACKHLGLVARLLFKKSLCTIF